MERFYIDCEFDGHNGPLLSIALVRGDGRGIHIATTATAQDPWVIANVVPLIERHNCRMAVRCLPNEVGAVIRTFIKCDDPVIIADSPVDIGRFCQALSTGRDGGWASADYARMTFEVHNVDCYPTTLPGAVQHNAWWDAMALREALRSAALSDLIAGDADLIDATHATIAALRAENERVKEERDKLLAEIDIAQAHELTDVEVEAALVGEGIYTWGPDGERFERMFAAAMKCRAAIAKAPD